MQTPNLDRLYRALVVPDLPVNPPAASSHPQITRREFVYQIPQDRLDVIRETMISLSEIGQGLKFLNQSDTEAGDNFPGAIDALGRILDQLVAYCKDKVEPWI